MNNILEKLARLENLSIDEAYAMQEKMISGDALEADILGVFEAFENKTMTDQELIGIVNATRDNMIKVDIDFDALDNCGTGGDGLNTFNISTAASFVLAAAGIPVAKHGNRAASSKCGSADVLEVLGANIMLDKDKAKKCLEKTGVAYLFAPLYHPALGHVKEARKKYGKRTYFNTIGPMLNPCGVKYQLIGISDYKKINIVAKTLLETGSKRVIIVHGEEGMDEISISEDTHVFDVIAGKGVDNYKINPREFGMGIFPIEEIKGGGCEENRKILMDVLNNNASEAQTNAVLLNSAGGMIAFGKVKSFEEGIDLARETIESGMAIRKFEEYIEFSSKL